MIVFDRALPRVEVGLIAFALGGGIDQVHQPIGAGSIAVDVEVGVADHIHNQECSDLL